MKKFLKKIEKIFKHPCYKLYMIIINIKNRKGKNNKVFIIDKNNNKKRIYFYHFLFIEFSGNNNIVEIHEDAANMFKNVTFFINGDNNYVFFDSTHKGIHNIELNIKNNNSKLIVGKDFYCGKCNFYLYGDTEIKIGNDCLFSFDLFIWATDGHPIYNKNKERINPNKSVSIGNHVWMCRGSTILKGGAIGDGCILGNSSMLTKDYSNYKNCVLAGNPAKIVKEDIYWKD